MRTVTLNLTTDVTYVTGTVNGKAYTFTLDSVHENYSSWTAEVDRATPDVYYCSITAIDNRGNTATFTTTLYYGLQLITDRTEDDVMRAQELIREGFFNWTDEEVTEFLNGLKGAYNASDLNRVESAVNYVKDRFAIIGYDALDFIIKNTWSKNEFLESEDAERYLGNVKKLREQFTMPPETPVVPEDMENFTFEEANDIERILEIIDEYITKIEKQFFYSGDLYGGEL